MVTKKRNKFTLSALMVSLCFLSTMIVQLPSPTGGYIHLGDGFVILSGILLGPLYGGLSAGMGSMLADLISGYATYALPTLLIKGIAAILSGILYKTIHKYYAIILAGVCTCFLVTLGYYLFESLLMGNGLAAAFVGVPGNIVQGIVGTLIATILYPMLNKVPQIRDYLSS